MNKSKEINSLLFEHKKELMKKYKIKRIGIFGSYSRGDQTDNSDIDILVEFEKPIGLEFVILAEELEEILKRKVDLVSKGALNPRAWQVIKEDLYYV